jgi:hypothetical protein
MLAILVFSHSNRPAMNRSHSLQSISGKTRGVAILALLTLAACSDGVTAPRTLDPDAVALVMPSVIDARQRVAMGLDDPSMRQQMRFEIQTLETALRENNVRQASASIDQIGEALNSHRASVGAVSQDASDLTAIELMLYAVSPVVRNARYDIRFKASQ